MARPAFEVPPMKYLVVIAGLLTTAALAAAPAASDTLSVLTLEHGWTHAATTGDHAKLDTLLDDDFVEVLPDGTRRSKREMLAAAALPEGGSQSLEGVHVRVNGDIAVVTGTNRYTPALGYRPIEFRFVDVWVKRAGQWRIASAQMRRAATGSI
jgi:ketosteroid isomerase-like protein